ncbi:hypothetical protein G6F66_013540 [Rhizopus arrhizus]|nr:hypothetical protein G6F66_013540 [Rhizopus arrhizus]
MVADDCAGDHDAGRAAHGLHDAPARQGLDRTRQGAAQGCHHEQRQPHHQRRLAAEAVGHRAVEHLRQRQADQVGRQRAFDVAARHAQVRRNGRERGQVHVDGERADRRQRARENEPTGQAAAGNWGWGHVGRGKTQRQGAHAVDCTVLRQASDCITGNLTRKFQLFSDTVVSVRKVLRGEVVNPLLSVVERKLEALPVPVQLVLPDGAVLGPPDPRAPWAFWGRTTWKAASTSRAICAM